MLLTEKIFFLKQVKPFGLLSENELLSIADVIKERTFLPGHEIITEGKYLNNIYVVVHGGIVDSEERDLGNIYGIRNLLLDLPAEDSVYSSDNGVDCLLISFEHFYTLLYECPHIAEGFMEKFNRDRLAKRI